MGLRTAREVLNAPRDMIAEKADLEDDTVDHLLSVLRAELTTAKANAEGFGPHRLPLSSTSAMHAATTHTQ